MRLFMVALAGTLVSFAQADKYRVTSLGDSGTGSFRWAINEANANPGPDRIKFAARLAGGVIKPLSKLPMVNDDQTTIDGDVDDDGKPDISINGKNCPDGSGLILGSGMNTIVGLCINNWPRWGIRARDTSSANRITSCYFGTNQDGTKALPNVKGDIWLEDCHDNTIGGLNATDRNVFSCGAEWLTNGVYVDRSVRNTIVGNYFGLAPDGATVIANDTGIGVSVTSEDPGAVCRDNYIGADTAGSRNVIAGLSSGIWIWGSHASHNYIMGNYIGLAADGDTIAGCETGIRISSSSDNQVGGLSPGCRNVIAGNTKTGVSISAEGAQDNRIEGNYIGINAAGTNVRKQSDGVLVWSSAGPQTIGSSDPAGGNYFATGESDTLHHVAVDFWRAGEGSVVRNNKFGVKPAGGAIRLHAGVWIDSVKVRVRENEFRKALHSGIAVYSDGSRTAPVIVENSFRECETAVLIYSPAAPNLGNLGTPASGDDGENVFASTNTWHIYNYSTERIKAENNDFGTTARSEINAKIYDKRDDGSLGRVDFDPLIGGVSPTGTTLGLTSLSAVPNSAGGAQVVFGLSAPARVEARVLNVAGRPVAAICRERACDAGLNALLWDGLSQRGLRVPAGVYLVEVSALGDEGQRQRAIATLRMTK